MLKNTKIKIKTNHSNIDQFILKYKLVIRPWPTHQIQYFDTVPSEAPILDKTHKTLTNIDLIIFITCIQ